jgi:hypothetical protein
MSINQIMVMSSMETDMGPRQIQIADAVWQKRSDERREAHEREVRERKFSHLVLSSIELDYVRPGSQPIELEACEDWRVLSPLSADTIEGIKAEIDAYVLKVERYGFGAFERTDSMLDVEADIDWRELDNGLPTAAELQLMAQDAQASDDLSLALRYLDPPSNNN